MTPPGHLASHSRTPLHYNDDGRFSARNGLGMLSVCSGYDPRYLTRAVAAGRENYYLSAVAEHGEPPGIWTGAGCRELGLAVGSVVDGPVLERLYERFIDPRDPAQAATLGRAPSNFAADQDRIDAKVARLLAAAPDP